MKDEKQSGGKGCVKRERDKTRHVTISLVCLTVLRAISLFLHFALFSLVSIARQRISRIKIVGG